MHRSGTSMVAKLLNQAGLYLGPDDALMPPASENPEGFFEHLAFVDLNDEIVSRVQEPKMHGLVRLGAPVPFEDLRGEGPIVLFPEIVIILLMGAALSAVALRAIARRQ